MLERSSGPILVGLGLFLMVALLWPAPTKEPKPFILTPVVSDLPEEELKLTEDELDEIWGVFNS